MTRHHAEANRGHTDARVTSLVGDLKSACHDLVEGIIQVIDREDDMGELARVPLLTPGGDRFAVGMIPQRRGRKVMELIAGGPHDHPVDTSEPHTTTVDGGNESIGLNLSDVAIDHIDLHKNSSLSVAYAMYAGKSRYFIL